MPAVVSPTSAPPLTPLADGVSPLAPERSTRGVSSPAPGGCHRAAASRTPRTLRLPNRPGPAGCRFDGSGTAGFHLPHLEPRPRGVVEVAVGEGHRLKQLGGPLRPRVGGQHGDDLELGVEGDP